MCTCQQWIYTSCKLTWTAESVQKMVFPAGKLIDPADAKAWRGAMRKVMTPEATMRLHLPAMVDYYTTQLRRCASWLFGGCQYHALALRSVASLPSVFESTTLMCHRRSPSPVKENFRNASIGLLMHLSYAARLAYDSRRRYATSQVARYMLHGGTVGAPKTCKVLRTVKVNNALDLVTSPRTCAFSERVSAAQPLFRALEVSLHVWHPN
jgi:hypothetical protein